MDLTSNINSIFLPRTSFKPADSKDLLVDVGDSFEVGIRLFISSKTNPTILFFHGNGEICHEYDDIGLMYNKYGLNLIVSDYRGYGLSNGIPTKENLHSDALIIFDYVRDYLINNNITNKLIIMGRSLGSASVCHILNNKNDFDICIIESGFSTEEFFFALFGISSDGYNEKDGFGNLTKISNYRKPLYIIHADNDDIVPFDNGYKLYEQCPSINKDILIVKGANHNNIIMTLNEQYFISINNFIKNAN